MVPSSSLLPMCTSSYRVFVLSIVASSLPDHQGDLLHSDDHLIADRLLNKIEKEQTNFDVQIGDGMDIGILGENGTAFVLTYPDTAFPNFCLKCEDDYIVTQGNLLISL